jgi:hypothetical protein
VLSRIVDRLKNRVDTGERTGSGGKVYVSTKPKSSKVKYPETKKPVAKQKSSNSDDPWLQGARSSGGAELKAQYRQLRGESTKSYKDFVQEAMSFEIGSGHNVAKKQAKIRNLAKATTNPGEKEAAQRKLKGPSLPMKEDAAWTRKEGKNKKGGLNEKGRKSYEAENPGSDLKAPSKKVGNPRRASFCARMSGLKKKLTSNKTANDPNSRINKSLRAWNC